MTLDVNEVVLNSNIRDEKHAASVICFTYELDNDKIEYEKVLYDLQMYGSHLVAEKKRGIKVYSVK